MKDKQFNFFATTAKGMESLLAEELQELGAKNIEEARAGITFNGSLACAYKICLWSRIANRVLLPLKTIKAHDAEELYDGIQSINWTDHLTLDRTFTIDFLAGSLSKRNSQLNHTHFAALKVKDAIVDQFRDLTGERPSIDTIAPDLRINVFLNEGVATVSIDLSGESLHRRGYREEGSEAPLKENLAAAILRLSGWPHENLANLIDPMCGSGTLPIEAALMARRIAPGLLRKSFGFLGWLGHDAALWRSLLQEAEEIKTAFQKTKLNIVGYDKDARVIRVARSNLNKAGLKDAVLFEHRELSDCEAHSDRGILVVNPPYGERLGEVEDLRHLYKALGDLMKNKFKGWQGYIFTSNADLAKTVGLRTSKRFVLYNGPIECRLLKYDLY